MRQLSYFPSFGSDVFDSLIDEQVVPDEFANVSVGQFAFNDTVDNDEAIPT